MICDDREKVQLTTVKSSDPSGKIEVQIPIQEHEQITYGFSLIFFSYNVKVGECDLISLSYYSEVMKLKSSSTILPATRGAKA